MQQPCPSGEAGNARSHEQIASRRFRATRVEYYGGTVIAAATARVATDALTADAPCPSRWITAKAHINLQVHRPSTDKSGKIEHFEISAKAKASQSSSLTTLYIQPI